MKSVRRSPSPAAKPAPQVSRPTPQAPSSQPTALRSAPPARALAPQLAAARSVSGSDERGVYPGPFGFAVNVPLQRSDRLVPVLADDAAALAPLADALALVRASGGFEASRLRVCTAEIRFVFDRVPDRAKATRRLRVLARDLLALGHDVGVEPALGTDFQPALELRCPEAQALSVHLYVEGTSPAHEALLGRFAERLEPALRALCESRPRIETPFVLRRRVLARCHVELDHLFASLPERAADLVRETRAVQRALHWLGAARREPGLAVAQNQLVLSNAARVARALDADGRRSTAEGHCHAARFGAALPLACFAAAGPRLVGALELPLAIDTRGRHGFDAALASGLMRGESIEDVGVLSTCLGLAAQLASVKAAISLALAGVVPARASVPPPHAAAEPARERAPASRAPRTRWQEEETVEYDPQTADRLERAEAAARQARTASLRASLQAALRVRESRAIAPAAQQGKSASRPPPPAPRRSREDSGVRPAVRACPAPPSSRSGERR